MDNASSGIVPSSAAPIMRSGNHPQNGFSLLEVLVAFVLLALTLATIMQIFSRGINGAALADQYAKATMIAESQLALAGIETPLKEGVTAGKIDEDFNWQMTVSAYQDASQDSANPAIQFMFVQLYNIQLSVTFIGGDQRERNVTLSTLQVGPKT